MTRLIAVLLLSLSLPLTVHADSHSKITSTASGEIVSHITARGTGGGSSFDGKVDQASDLEDLVELAWGHGWLGLHRGHAPVEEVLKAFLGISHDEMHVLMEDHQLNLAATCEYLGFKPENLVESLTASFLPFLQQGVENDIIKAAEVESWTTKIRNEFRRRVYWKG